MHSKKEKLVVRELKITKTSKVNPKIVPSLLMLVHNQISQDLKLTYLLLNDTRIKTDIKQIFMANYPYFMELRMKIVSLLPLEDLKALYLTSTQWKKIVEKAIEQRLLPFARDIYLLLVDSYTNYPKLKEELIDTIQKYRIFNTSSFAASRDLSPQCRKEINEIFSDSEINQLLKLYDFFESKMNYLREQYDGLENAPRNNLLARLVKVIQKKRSFFLNEPWFKEVKPYLQLFPQVMLDVYFEKVRKQNEGIEFNLNTTVNYRQ